MKNNKSYAQINLSKYKEEKPKLNAYQPKLQLDLFDFEQQHDQNQPLQLSEDQSNANLQYRFQQNIKNRQIQYSTLNLQEHSQSDYQLQRLSKLENNHDQQKYKTKISSMNQQNFELNQQIIVLKKKLKTQQQKYNKLDEENKSVLAKYKNKIVQLEQLVNTYKKKNQRLQLKVSEAKENINHQNLSNIGQNQNGVYEVISRYLKKRIAQLTQELKKVRMNQKIQSLLETFFEEIININSTTTNRVVNKNQKIIQNDSLSNCQALTPTSVRYRELQNVSQKIDKSFSILQLQKSLEKLRDMEKTNFNYRSSTGMDSLDRSSIMGNDRSKSRRKKIFN